MEILQPTFAPHIPDPRKQEIESSPAEFCSGDRNLSRPSREVAISSPAAGASAPAQDADFASGVFLSSQI
jgi:hypothetical protein